MKEVKLTLTKTYIETLHDTRCDKRLCHLVKTILLCSKSWVTAIIAQTLSIHETTIV